MIKLNQYKSLRIIAKSLSDIVIGEKLECLAFEIECKNHGLECRKCGALQLGDALIAATALDHGLTVLTANTNHFSAVNTLPIECFMPQ